MSEEEQREHASWQAASRPYLVEVMQVARSSAAHTSCWIDHTNRELVVVGVGQPTQALLNVMKRAPENIRVTWLEAPYTSAELSTETLRILKEQPTRLNGGGATPDGTGIRFTTTDAELLTVTDPQDLLGSRYPVTIEYGTPGTLA